MPTRPQFETEEQPTNAQIRAAMAQAIDGFTPSNIEAWKCVAELREKYRKLPRRSSFSGLAVESEIERAEHNPEYIGDPSDYTGDLFAVQAAFLTLSASERDDFTKHLYEVLGGKGLLRQSDLLAATPRQWSLAYCRTKGLLP